MMDIPPAKLRLLGRLHRRMYDSAGPCPADCKKEFRVEIEQGAMWFKADWHTAVGNDALVVEVESGQKHPSTNVLKYLPLLMEHDGLRLVLVHVFCRRTTQSARRDLALYCGRHMAAFVQNKRFRYVPLEQGQLAGGADAALDGQLVSEIFAEFCPGGACPEK